MNTSSWGLCVSGGLVLVALWGAHQEANAATLQPIYDFGGGPGNAPWGNLISDAAGNLYGVTARDGSGNCDCGTVFELSPPAPGDKVWIRKTLFSFYNSLSEGKYPFGTLAMDVSGNLYGLSNNLLNSEGATGWGAIYKLSHPEAGQSAWTEKLLYVFSSSKFYATGAGLLIDSAGTLYGTGATSDGQGDGMVFKLSPPAANHNDWDFTIIHRFTGPDGTMPYYLTIGPSGVLYGTTTLGGANNRGVVYQLTPPGTGHTVWTEKVLYNVAGFAKGSYPNSPLIADSSGALYGGLASGTKEPGEIFKLTPPAAGHTVWEESTIFKFSEQNPSAGLNPFGSFAFDTSGALYGETYNGGADNAGVVFQLSPPAAGTGRWSETVLSSLKRPVNPNPVFGVVANQTGNVFGVQNDGNSYDGAAIFEITP